MKFSLMHPTARVRATDQFPWFMTCAAWIAKAARPSDLEYIVVVHESRLSAFWAELQRAGIVNLSALGAFKVVVNHGRDCNVDQSNEGLKAVTGEIVVFVEDDLFPPLDWDLSISESVPDTLAPVVVHCSSGSPRDAELFIPGIVTLAVVREIGPTSPEYISMFADDESTLRLRRVAHVVERPDIVFDHRHPSLGKSSSDAVYELENASEAYRIGRAVFNRRRAAGFPRVELPGWPHRPAQKINGVLKSAALALGRAFDAPGAAPERRKMAVCLPGETFSMEWLCGMLSVQAVLADMGFDFDAILGYNSGPHVTRIGMVETFLDKHVNDFSTPYVLWLDDDNIVPVETVRRWVNFFEANPQADIVCGWCWIRKGASWRPSIAQFTNDGAPEWMQPAELLASREIRRVDRLASGFPAVMMRREVLEHLGPGAFSLIADSSVAYGHLGEDFSFFHRAWRSGLACYVDPLGKLVHLKLTGQEPQYLYEALEPQQKAVLDVIQGRPVTVPSEARDMVL